MPWIYLSPHLDDVALSCGGLAYEQARAGEDVQVWTICAGDPPVETFSAFAASLHARWGVPARQAVQQRREEDLESCARLGVQVCHFAIPDCIYRHKPGAPSHSDQALYASETAIFGELHPAEAPLVDALVKELEGRLPWQATLVCPLTLGGHVDHRLTRLAAERLDRPVWYYADYPYVLLHGAALEALRLQGWQTQVFPVSPAGLLRWQAAVEAHASQVSSFWPDLVAMRQSIAAYCASMAGVELWQPPVKLG